MPGGVLGGGATRGEGHCSRCIRARVEESCLESCLVVIRSPTALEVTHLEELVHLELLL